MTSNPTSSDQEIRRALFLRTAAELQVCHPDSPQLQGHWGSPTSPQSGLVVFPLWGL